MPHESRSKRPHSIDTTPLRRSNSLDSPTRDAHIGTHHKQRNLNKTPSPDESEVDMSADGRAPRVSSMRQPQGQPTGFTTGLYLGPIVDSAAKEMTDTFAQISDAFDRLHTMKITVTEESQRFGKLPRDHRIAQIKNYPLDYCQDLLESEMMSNEKLKDKNALLMTRNYELEQRLEFVETNVERMQQEAINKAEQAVRNLIGQFSRQEIALIASRDAEANTVRELRDSNQGLKTSLKILDDTKKRQDTEISQLRKDIKQMNDELKHFTAQNKQLEGQVTENKRQETELTKRYFESEESLRRAQDEVRTLSRDLREQEKENNRLKQLQKKEVEQLQQEKRAYRDELQEMWNGFKLRSDEEHKKKIDQYEEKLENLKRALDEAIRDLECAQEKVRQLEKDREVFEYFTRDKLQRKMLTHYRDIVQEIGPNREVHLQPDIPVPTQYRHSLTDRLHHSSSNKENDDRFTGPSTSQKKEVLTEVLGRAATKIGRRQ